MKDPPYTVKESGYAGFNLPIEVYLKNKEEPRKLQFYYELEINTSGPPLKNIQREQKVFSNPSEDFRRKLIRGGGVSIFFDIFETDKLFYRKYLKVIHCIVISCTLYYIMLNFSPTLSGK